MIILDSLGKRKIGAFLKESREKAQLSQKKVGLALGYESPQYVSNWERGICIPPLNKLRKLQSLFSIEPEILSSKVLDEVKRILKKWLIEKNKLR